MSEPRLVVAALWVDGDSDEEATAKAQVRLAHLGSEGTRGAVISFGPEPGRDLLRELRRFQLDEVADTAPASVLRHRRVPA